MKPGKKAHLPLLLLGLILGGILVVGSTVGFSRDDRYEVALRQRASRVFTYDREVSKLPSNQLYGLSIALRFKDYNGAETLLKQLEPRVR